MKYIPIDDIKISEDRQRKILKPSAIDDLEQSIKEVGLLQPLLITEDNYLIAGFRRYTAMKSIFEDCKKDDRVRVIWFDRDWAPSFTVPCITLSELSSTHAFEAELHENIKRVDLTWQEKAKAIARLDALRKEQSPTHTSRDTARELRASPDESLGKYSGEITRANLVSQHLEDEDIKKSVSLDEAYKKVLKKSERVFNALLDETIGKEEESLHRVIHGDSFKVLEELEDHQFDCIITDPPYGIGADNFGTAAKLDHEYKDTEEYAINCLRLVMRNATALTREEAHLYIFCSIDLFFFLRNRAEKEGWWPWPTPLIWYKPSSAHAPHPDYGPKRSYECIFYAIKGGKKTNYLDSDVMRVSTVQDKEHAAEKPVELYERLLTNSCRPGDRVLDPFCGSGNIFIAGSNNNVKITGIEKNKEFYREALLRSKQKNG